MGRAFAESGYEVIGTDLVSSSDNSSATSHFIPLDLAELAKSEASGDAFFSEVRRLLKGAGLAVLVNNAAVQIVRPVPELTREDMTRSFSTNVLAPFLFIRALLPELEMARGSVVNISSIHATLTKPDFVAYATSKAALSGLTRALAVELGSRVRVNGIAPAAVATPLLEAGFQGNEAGLAALAAMHPVRRIGRPEEVAALAVFLASDHAQFLNGAVLPLDGGIGSRLHDPS